MEKPRHSSSSMMMMMLSRFLVVMLVAVLERPATVNADVSTDRSKCANDLMALSTCLQYVSGSSKMPTPDCCDGMKKVLGQSPKCLCLLIKDRDDPSIGLKIDPTRAMSLPSDCNTHANISHCPKLLNLPPNSPDAKIFTDFGEATPGNSTATVSNSSANLTHASSTVSGSDVNGRLMSWWLGVKVVGGLLTCYYSLFGSFLLW